eukprot:SAG22_NODE_1676_length_3830_cov_3.388100_5_plen_285_part_00
MWKVDELPKRVAALKQELVTSHRPGRSTVVLVHCTAGCDRTGEVIGAYRLKHGGLGGDGTYVVGGNVTEMYALDMAECGRPPNYWSTTALEWYCFELLYNGGEASGDCTGFATCKPLDHGQPCVATNSTGPPPPPLQAHHAAYTGGSCPGICQPDSAKCGLPYKTGMCPGNANIKCCPQPTPKCNGQCQDTTVPCAAPGHFVPGHCPGSAKVQCCEAGRPRPPPAPPPGPPPKGKVFGPDTSHYSGKVDWAAVKAAGAGFGITKATEGTSYTDPTFKSNWAGAD